MTERAGNQTEAPARPVQPTGPRPSQRDLVIKSLILCPEPDEKSRAA